jgi:hypothetical protein
MVKASRLIVASMVMAVGAPVGAAASASASSTGFKISATSVAGVDLGTGQLSSLRAFRQLFGAPTHTSLPGGLLPRAERACGYTGEVSWSHLDAFYYRDHLVGYAAWAQRVRTLGGATRSVATDRGLRVGDSLSRARALYGGVTRSNAQGGSWAVHTATGRMLGYSQGSRLSSPIVSIEAGHVGCTALAPQP